MKTTSRILLFALLALATELILSCAPPPVTIDDRLASFVTSLNGNRSDTYTNCDPNSSNYAAAKSPSVWDGYFAPGSEPFSIVPGYSTSNPAAVVVTLNGAGSFYGTYTFGFVNSPNMGSDNWLIGSIKQGVTTIF